MHNQIDIIRLNQYKSHNITHLDSRHERTLLDPISTNTTTQALTKTTVTFLLMILIWTPPGLARDISCFGKKEIGCSLISGLAADWISICGP
ncbi:hypothetical protein, partial [Nitrosomonas sp. Nm58]|uniref:hypothetical protein n=1 Tax=Nitrosomonas sp. Nm58 TaxID=200126 RepID=UPI000899686D